MDMTTDLTNMTSVITWATSNFNTIMGIFMQPPLLYFTAFGIFVAIVYIAARFFVHRK